MAVAEGGFSNSLLEHLQKVAEIEAEKQAVANHSVALAERVVQEAQEALQNAQSQQREAAERTAVARKTLTAVRQYFCHAAPEATPPQGQPGEREAPGTSPFGGDAPSARKRNHRPPLKSFVLKVLACGNEMTVGEIYKGVLPQRPETVRSAVRSVLADLKKKGLVQHRGGESRKGRYQLIP